MKLEHEKLSGEATVQEAVTEVAAIMGENVVLRRGFLVSPSPSGIVSSYLHASAHPGPFISKSFSFGYKVLVCHREGLSRFRCCQERLKPYGLMEALYSGGQQGSMWF